MKALIDADILCYEFGNMKDLDTGELLAWEITRSFVDERISSILEATKATSHKLYLTDSKSNFRNKVATILPYKGHRPSDKPPHWENIRLHLVDNYDAEVCYGIEADDACGIAQCAAMDKHEALIRCQSNNHSTRPEDKPDLSISSPTIICSRDKDLSMIPGWHYQWPCGNQQERKWFVSETDGLRFFYKQLLTGDSTDNILGLYRVGPKATCVKALDRMNKEKDMALHVISEYKARFGSYWHQFMAENAQLLWILRTDMPEDLSDKIFVDWRDWDAKEEDT